VKKALELDPDLPRAHQRLCEVLVTLQDRGAPAACARAGTTPTARPVP